MAIVNKFNVNNKQVTLDADIIENMSANDVSYNASTQYNKNSVGYKLSKLESENDVFKETVTEQLNNYEPIVINGNVTNAQDEEDLTSVNGLLKFKNRSTLNGMGYVILRKDKSFSEQVTLSNTIYEIRYDFILNENITIPANCVLKFDGGSISVSNNNYTITGNNTNIQAGLIKIFNTNITFVGTWNVTEIYSNWFDCTTGDPLNQIISLCNSVTKNNIFINDNMTIYPTGYYGYEIPSNTDMYISGTLTKDSNVGHNTALGIRKSENVRIFGGIIDGNINGTDEREYGHGIIIHDSKRVTVSINIIKCAGDGIYIGCSSDSHNNNISIRNCCIKECSRQGISVIDCNNLEIINCVIDNIDGVAPSAGINFEPNKDYNIIQNVIIKNITCDGCWGGIYLSIANGIGRNFIIDNLICKNIKRGNCFSSNGDILNVVVRNCTFNSEITTGNSIYGDQDAIKFENCIINVASAIYGHFEDSTITCKSLYEVANGIYKNCNIITNKLGGSGVSTNKSLILDSCKIVLNGALAFSTKQSNVIIKNCIIDITAQTYCIFAVHLIKFEMVGNIFNIHSATRDLFSFTQLDDSLITDNIINVDDGINYNIIYVGSGTNNVVNNNIFNLPTSFINAKYVGINTKTSTTNREGSMIFDNGKPILYNGTTWVDATGAPA